MLNYYQYPCTHAVLENVFAKELGKISNIVWLFQGHSNPSVKVKKWHNSYIIFSKKIQENNVFSILINKALLLTRILTVIRILYCLKIDIILVRDLPLYTILLAPLKNFKKFKLFFQYSAPQGDISIRFGNTVSGFKRYWHLLKGYGFNLIINRALKKSDVVFPISEFHKHQLRKTINIKKMTPITMGVDIEWTESEGQKIDCVHQLNKNFKLITYFGSLSITRNPQFIIKIYAKVKQRYQDSKLIMIGAGVDQKDEEMLRKLSRKLDVYDDVIFTGRVSREVIRACLSSSVLTISAIPPESHYKISSPTKLYESMGVGIPVVANLGIPEQEKVLLESKGGILVKYDVDEFCDSIVYLLFNPEILTKMAEEGRLYIMRNYTYEKIASNIANHFV